jgi:hypothetical protein
MKNTNKAVILCFFLSSITSGAFADVKNYLASSCEVDTTSASYSDEYRYSNSFGYLENMSTTEWLYVTCPMVRDDTVTDNIASSGWVRVRDWHSTESVTCSLYRVYSSGTVASGTSQSSVGSSSSVQVLNFANLTQGPSTDTMHFKCRIPPADGGQRPRINSYSINEL